MSLLPVLAHFVEVVLKPAGTCPLQCQTFIAMCNMVDFITSVNRGRVTGTMIRDSVHTFLGLFVAVWGVSYLTPKFHWLLHFARAFERWGTLLACFVNERFHRNPKTYATELENTTGKASLHLLKEVICHTLAKLDMPGALVFEVGPINPRKPNKYELELITACFNVHEEDVETFIANCQPLVSVLARYNKFGTCNKSDIVLVRGERGNAFSAARVLLHMSVDGDAVTLVNMFQHKRVSGDGGYSEWYETHEPTVILTVDILDTVISTKLRDGVCGVLLPCEYR